MPRRIVREAKAEAARRGSTLAAFVGDALERQLQSGAASDPVADELESDAAWYRAHRETLVRKFAGQCVAIVGGRVIDHDDDFEALAERVFSNMPDRSVFMPLIEPEERVVRLRSPRRAR